jgi:GNAT superfamily N-acetyltransferase
VPVTLFSAAQRPDLVVAADALSSAVYPPFMQHDPVSAECWSHLYGATLAPFQTIAADEVGEVVALGNAIPFHWPAGDELPDDGWDAVLRRGVDAIGARPNALSALSIVIRPDHRGTGLAERLLEQMKVAATAAGLTALVAPVRPTRKADYPLQDFALYCAWTRADGAPFDPWIRTHWRLGAVIVKPALRSMTIPGSVADWQAWTGLGFPESGSYWFAGGLAPLTVDLARDAAVYVEPNLWMRHRL